MQIGFRARTPRDQHERGMLENRRQHDHRGTLGARQHQLRCPHAKLRLAAQHRFHHIGAGRGLNQPHVQPGVAVIALRDGGVVARELKLVPPLELQRDRHQPPIGRRARGRLRGTNPAREQNREQQPCNARRHPLPTTKAASGVHSRGSCISVPLIRPEGKQRFVPGAPCGACGMAGVTRGQECTRAFAARRWRRARSAVPASSAAAAHVPGSGTGAPVVT